jgi:hypothetical protein
LQRSLITQHINTSKHFLLLNISWFLIHILAKITT